MGEDSYPSAEMQSVYSTAPADWAGKKEECEEWKKVLKKKKKKETKSGRNKKKKKSGRNKV